eukprot:6186225-Pleurochrysis_carterae.AAC.2
MFDLAYQHRADAMPTCKTKRTEIIIAYHDYLFPLSCCLSDASCALRALRHAHRVQLRAPSGDHPFASKRSFHLLTGRSQCYLNA